MALDCSIADVELAANFSCGVTLRGQARDMEFADSQKLASFSELPASLRRPNSWPSPRRAPSSVDQICHVGRTQPDERHVGQSDKARKDYGQSIRRFERGRDAKERYGRGKDKAGRPVRQEPGGGNERQHRKATHDSIGREDFDSKDNAEPDHASQSHGGLAPVPRQRKWNQDRSA